MANRPDSYAEDAKSKGFTVTPDFSAAAKVADGSSHDSCYPIVTLNPTIVLFLLIPDQTQPRVVNEQIAPNLKEGCTIVVASGYNVFYKLLDVPAKSNVVMVAPRSVNIRSKAEQALLT